tara:strand:+ start:317 stop:1147 length:831 start_codon:yes stop_codon:yes gene_type:complete
VESKLNLSAKSKQALLFDMDGTLTPARKTIDVCMVALLQDLCTVGHLVCVVSGSPLQYIEQQLLIDKIQWPKNLVLMPCNGTQVCMQNESSNAYDEIYKVTMSDHLAASSSLLEPHRALVHNILELQLYAMRRYNFSTTGNFVSDRKSMINWSMIGRDASHEVRDAFAIEDFEKGIRKHLRECLRVRLDDSDLHEIDLTLGGSTSIDIFPKGWDKTYALNHLNPDLIPWFWGDKCQQGGNDHTLWRKLQAENRSFEVKSPRDTLVSIQNLTSRGIL